MNKQSQRSEQEAKLVALWRNQLLKNYMGCGYPDDDWFTTAIAKHYPKVELLTDEELVAALTEFEPN